jgi:hypothetical protein
MDEHIGYKLMKVKSDKWKKIRGIIDKDTTKLCIFEVPKGVSILANARIERVYSSILPKSSKATASATR